MIKNHLSEGSGMFMPLHNKPAALTDNMSSQFRAANTNKEHANFIFTYCVLFMTNILSQMCNDT